MLLGRPWLFDRKVMHNGYLNNTYSFTKDGKKITLALLVHCQLHLKKPTKDLEHSDLFLTFSESLLKTSHHKFQAFREWILTIQDEYKNSLPKHPLAMSPFQTYARVFPKEIPLSLPPKHDIQH